MSSKETLLREGPGRAREWSIESEPGAGGEPYRLVVAVDPPEDALIEVSDAQVTSKGPSWKVLVGKYPKMHLTTEEALWLAETLKGAVEHLRQQNAEVRAAHEKTP